MLSQKRLVPKSTSHKRWARSEIEHSNADATPYQIGTLEQILTTGNRVSTPRSAQAQHLESNCLCESPCAHATCWIARFQIFRGNMKRIHTDYIQKHRFRNSSIHVFLEISLEVLPSPLRSLGDLLGFLGSPSGLLVVPWRFPVFFFRSLCDSPPPKFLVVERRTTPGTTNVAKMCVQQDLLLCTKSL